MIQNNLSELYLYFIIPPLKVIVEDFNIQDHYEFWIIVVLLHFYY